MTSNHFSAGPDRRVLQRTEQAAYAAITDAIRASHAYARVVVGGDLTLFPRPDDPFRRGDALFPSDQLAALYEAKLENVYEGLIAEQPSTAYSFLFLGTGTDPGPLLCAPGRIREESVEIRSAKTVVDWPAETEVFGRFGASDHDPEVARFFAVPNWKRSSIKSMTSRRGSSHRPPRTRSWPRRCCASTSLASVTKPCL
jgi:uncharacterized protein